MPPSSSSNTQDWGSVPDSDVNQLLDDLSDNSRANIKPSHPSSFEPTQKDDSSVVIDVLSSQTKDELPEKAIGTSSSFFKRSPRRIPWKTMNDSQFIEYVNKLGSEHSQVRNTSNIADTTKHDSSVVIPTQPDILPPSQPDLTLNSSPKFEPVDEGTPKSEAEPVTKVQATSSGTFDFNTMDEEELFDELEKPSKSVKPKEPAENNSSDDPVIHLDQILKDKPKNTSPQLLSQEFGDFGAYFHNKQIKQQMEDRKYVDFMQKATKDVRPPIFKGCIIYVNGKTKPDIAQLHKMIVLHGGTFLAYLGAKGNATHIIAEILTPRKRLEFRNYKVVKPAWIVDSISAGKMLPWSDYMLINNDYGQKKLAFPKAKDSIIDEPVQISQISEYESPEKPLETGPEDDTPEDDYGHMTAKDPRFLENFFAKSRLHHLSTWKMDLRSRFLQRAIQKLRKRHPKKASGSRTIIHVDFDCFFATVSALKHDPPLDIHKIPICVTHGSNGSDVASCNYIARAKGCRNGMWLGRARKMCPDLVCLDYNFKAYEAISRDFYDCLLELDVDSILPVSVDEALLDVTSICRNKTPDTLMHEIRKAVFHKTGCSVSCGCGSNVLLAKLCLRKAKPDGKYMVKPEEVPRLLEGIKFRSLPGIGYNLTEKLERSMHKKDVNVGAVRSIKKSKLVGLFGKKTGTTIYEYAHGIDHTSIDILSDPAKFTRKSLSININWGVRFDTSIEVEEFLGRLAKALSDRLEHEQMKGSILTLKLAMRSADAPVNPPKFLGMGRCDFVSKSSRLGMNSREIGTVTIELKYLWRILGQEPKELRGIAVTMGKLVSDDETISVGQKKFDVKRVVTENNEEATIVKQLRASPKKGDRYKPMEINRDEINWDVFKELPPDIQHEIKHELRRRDMESSPRKNYGPSRVVKVSDVLRTPTKSRYKYRKLTRTDTITPALADERANLRFQGIPITRFGQIKEKILEWMQVTIGEEDALDEGDMEMFTDMMFKLIEIGEPLKYLDVLDTMDVRLMARKACKGYGKWKEVVEQLRDIFDESDAKIMVYGF